MATKQTSDGKETIAWTIIWLDSNVNQDPDNHAAQEKLGELCDHFRAFEVSGDCEEYVGSNQRATIILLVSGRLSREIIPKIEDLRQISAIFIYCMDASRHIDWATKHRKIVGIPVRLDELLNGIRTYQLEKESSFDPKSAHPPPSKKVRKHPFDGYEKIPVIPLPKAAAPLCRFVPDLSQKVQLVMDKCRDLSDELTCDEAASLMLLTLPWSNNTFLFTKILNETIVENEFVLIQQWFIYIKLVLHALSKLPDVTRAVYRFVDKDVSHDYTRDKIIDDWLFTICNSSIKNLEEEKLKDQRSRTLFTMECRTGKDISKYSFKEDSDTILLLPGRRWKVISCFNAGDNLHIIQMQEIEDLMNI